MASDSQILAVIQYCFERMPTSTNDTCTAMVNEVAHQLRDTGLESDAGLISKSSGQEHGTGSDGNYYAVDALWVQRPGRAADILASAPTNSSPWLFWYSLEQMPPLNSYRLPYGARTLPLYGGVEPPDPPDPPDPPPTACLFQPTDLTPVYDRLAALEAQHAQLLQAINSGGWPVTVSNSWLTLRGIVGGKPQR